MLLEIEMVEVGLSLLALSLLTLADLSLVTSLDGLDSTL